MASRTARKGTSRYKIRNWKQYEAGLIQRGSISFWINDDAIDQWNPEAKGHWCTNRHFDKNIVGLLFFHYFHLKIWLSWHLAQQGKVQVVIK